MSKIVLETVMIESTKADLAKKELRVVFSLGLDEQTLEQVNKLGILAVNEVPVYIIIGPAQPGLPFTGNVSVKEESTDAWSPDMSMQVGHIDIR